MQLGHWKNLTELELTHPNYFNSYDLIAAMLLFATEAGFMIVRMRLVMAR